MKPGQMAGPSQPPKKRIEVNKDMSMICPYSAKKKRANVIAEYSTLNPETSSDSPSAKSNGGLFVSANAETKNIPAAGNKGITNQISFCARTIEVRLKSPTHRITEIIINPIDTS